MRLDATGTIWATGRPRSVIVTSSPAAASATTAEAFCFKARMPTSDMFYVVARVVPKRTTGRRLAHLYRLGHVFHARLTDGGGSDPSLPVGSMLVEDLPAPSLDAFPGGKPGDPQRRHRVGPPPADRGIEDQPGQQDG